jgi:hypothetical protein
LGEVGRSNWGFGFALVWLPIPISSGRDPYGWLFVEEEGARSCELLPRLLSRLTCGPGHYWQSLKRAPSIFLPVFADEVFTRKSIKFQH